TPATGSNSATTPDLPTIDAGLIPAPVPGLTLDKRVKTVADVNSDGVTDAGDTIVWEFEVANTGDVDLTGVGVADPLAGAPDWPATSLAAGASMVCSSAPYTITAADVTAGVVHNSATAHGTPPSGPEVTTPPDTTDTPVKPTPPSLVSIGDYVWSDT